MKPPLPASDLGPEQALLDWWVGSNGRSGCREGPETSHKGQNKPGAEHFVIFLEGDGSNRDYANANTANLEKKTQAT